MTNKKNNRFQLKRCLFASYSGIVTGLVYGTINNTNQLHLAGLGAGILIGLLMFVLFLSTTRKISKRQFNTKYDFYEALKTPSFSWIFLSYLVQVLCYEFVKGGMFVIPFLQPGGPMQFFQSGAFRFVCATAIMSITGMIMLAFMVFLLCDRLEDA